MALPGDGGRAPEAVKGCTLIPELNWKPTLCYEFSPNELEREIATAEETVQALRGALEQAEARLLSLRAVQRRRTKQDDAGKTASQSQKIHAQFGRFGSWLAKQSEILLQQAEAADEKEAALRRAALQKKEDGAEAALRSEADFHSAQVVRQHVLRFLDTQAHAREAEDREGLFFRWLRDFHSEYDEAWFEQNLMRIDLAFRQMFEEAVAQHQHQSPLRKQLGASRAASSAESKKGEVHQRSMSGHVQCIR
ncbi:unnamed protein product [Symbiodinium natans]|uniref:Uncharacterized protein n=1 Tax=Symbiodinium natans TaxID=878477 RepID=A0A812U200_9DINO|nr:unnamed protein product [Symbiodinium natans]